MDTNHGEALWTAATSIAPWQLRLGYLIFLGFGPWPVPDGMVTTWTTSRQPAV